MQQYCSFTPLRHQRSGATLALVVDRDRLKAQGARIKELRRLAPGRPSQETVAHAVGVTMRGYQAWERGESEIRWENLERLAEYLQVSPDFIEYGRPKARGETPDMAKTLDIGAEILARLGEVQTQIDSIDSRLDNLYGIIERLAGAQIAQAAMQDTPQEPRQPGTKRRRGR